MICECNERGKQFLTSRSSQLHKLEQEIYTPELINIAILNCVGLITNASELRVGGNK